jgi:hypothetical protein
MPRLSLGLGVQAVSKVKSGAPAPSGIVAATAGNLIISFGFPDPIEYVKNSNTQWAWTDGAGVTAFCTWNDFAALTWVLNINDPEIIATNPSVNPLIIPTTGWTYTTGSGPSITITAA